jgi:hypothetical protein
MNQTGKDRAVAGVLALGWASLAVAASELFAPRSVQTLLGLDDHRKHRSMLRALGMRELLHGVRSSPHRLRAPTHRKHLGAHGGRGSGLSTAWRRGGKDQSAEAPSSHGSSRRSDCAARRVLCYRKLTRLWFRRRLPPPVGPVDLSTQSCDQLVQEFRGFQRAGTIVGQLRQQ